MPLVVRQPYSVERTSPESILHQSGGIILDAVRIIPLFCISKKYYITGKVAVVSESGLGPTLPLKLSFESEGNARSAHLLGNSILSRTNRISGYDI